MKLLSSLVVAALLATLASAALADEPARHRQDSPDAKGPSPATQQPQGEPVAPRGFLGIEFRYKGIEVAAAGGLPVISCVPGGPADVAGIGPGDVVTGLNGSAVTSGEDFTTQVKALPPGTVVTLTVKRDGKEVDVPVTLGTRPADK
jgi:S1-C subfamily serine protease